MPITVSLTGDFAENVHEEVKKLFRMYDQSDLDDLVRYAVAKATESRAGGCMADPPQDDALVASIAAAEETAKAKRTRRTKAQIEADEAAAKAAAQPTPLEAAISATPEDRVNPEDEAAEEADGIEDMADGPAPDAPLTTDDLRTVAGRIVYKFNNDVAKAQAACVSIFKANGVESISKCPDDKIAVVHAALTAIANGSAS